MRLSQRIERLEKEAANNGSPVTIPESYDEVMDYLRRSQHSFAPEIIAMLREHPGDDYALSSVCGLLNCPDPEALHQQVVKVYG